MSPTPGYHGGHRRAPGVQMTARHYRIRLDGVLGTRFETAFDGFHLEREATGTVLVGTCADSSALFGVLGRIEALGLGLLTVDSCPVDGPGRV